MAEPMDCREAADRLHDYLKRELTPELEVEVRIHLERCRPCFAHAQFEERFLRLIEEHGRRTTCPGSLRERIVRLLRAEAERG